MSLSFLYDLLEKQRYVIAATADANGQPNAAPMFYIYAENVHLYLVDYTLGQTYRNLKTNPKICISVSDMETLHGYKIRGSVNILTEGSVFEKIYKEFENKAVELSVKRVIEGIRQNKRHKQYEAGMPEKVIIYQIAVDELTEIGPQGSIERKFPS